MSEKEKTGAAGAAPTTATQVDPSVELANKLTAAEKVISDQKADLEAAKKTIDAQKAEIENQKKELADAGEIITDLKDQLKGKVNKVPTVKVGKEKYLVLGGFANKGKKYTAKDIAANPEIAAKLVSRGSGLLKLSK